MTDERIKEVIMTDGNKCIVKQTDTLMAEKMAEICRDYTPDSALSENEVRIACYRIETEMLAKIDVLEKVLDCSERGMTRSYVENLLDELKEANQ